MDMDGCLCMCLPMVKEVKEVKKKQIIANTFFVR